MGFNASLRKTLLAVFQDKLSNEKSIGCSNEEADEGDVEEGQHVSQLESGPVGQKILPKECHLKK